MKIFKADKLKLTKIHKGPPIKYPLKTMKVNESFFVSEKMTTIKMQHVATNAYMANKSMAPKRFKASRVTVNGEKGILIQRIK